MELGLFFFVLALAIRIWAAFRTGPSLSDNIADRHEERTTNSRRPVRAMSASIGTGWASSAFSEAPDGLDTGLDHDTYWAEPPASHDSTWLGHGHPVFLDASVDTHLSHRGHFPHEDHHSHHTSWNDHDHHSNHIWWNDHDHQSHHDTWSSSGSNWD